MKHLFKATFISLLFALSVSMVKHPAGVNRKANVTTQVVFWSDNPSYGNIQVYVEGVYAGSIKQFYNAVPACFASGCVTAQNVGPNSQFSAKTDDGKTVWDAQTFLGMTLCACNSYKF
jgi:hypothetical protein